MKSSIYLLKHTNYYSRRIIRYDTVQDYIDQSDSYLKVGDNINFAIGDSVNTSLIVNITSVPYDYLLEVNDSNIVSRWFIMEAMQISLVQYRLTLRRDVIADNLAVIEDSPMYIEKATVPSVEDVAIYNKESLQLNQIKSKETLLKDQSKVAWLVGYYTQYKNAQGDPASLSHSISVSTSFDKSFASRSEFPTTFNCNSSVGVELEFALYLDNSSRLYHKFYYYKNGSVVKEVSNVGGYIIEIDKVSKPYNQTATIVKNAVDSYNWKEVYDEVLASVDMNYVLDFDNKIVLDLSTGKKYRSRINFVYNEINYVPAKDSTIPNNFKTVLIEKGLNAQETYSAPIRFTGSYFEAQVSYTEIDASTDAYTWTIPGATNTLQDAPYKMFTIPFEPVEESSSKFGGYTLDKLTSLAIANDIAIQLDSYLVDLQLLPYCPVQGDLIGDNEMILLGTESVDYSFITQNGVKKSFILFPKESTFTFDIEESIELPYNVVEQKIINQADTYRLCSPNQASSFEFNPVATGSITTFNVDCTYKPISPYIHLNPVWSRLYGQDYNDTRGLICSGDFSIARINDQWITYQTNNKNYQNSFDRNIESIELQNNWQFASSIASAISGTVQSAAVGTMVGGAKAGGILGGLSAIGGTLDVIAGQQMRMDELDRTKDQFNFSLRNIQSLPQTVSKISTFDANNKIFPILEYYTCTPQEKDILRSKMQYDGMTIMRIGTIGEFIQSNLQFIKGRLIRIDLGEDHHLINEISLELEKGIYL